MAFRYIAAAVLLFAIECTAFQRPSDLLVNILKEESTNQGNGFECKVIPPSNFELVSSSPDGVILHFQWRPKGSECTKAGLYFELFHHSTNEMLSRTVAGTNHFRGLVFRNLTEREVYRLEALALGGNQVTRRVILRFITGVILEVKMNQIGISKSDLKKEISDMLKSAEESILNEEGCKKLSPPTNGRLTKLSNNSATLQFNWKHSEGDCVSYALHPTLYQETGTGKKRIAFSSISVPPSHIRGDFFTNLDSDTEYLYEAYTDGANRKRSSRILVPFRTTK